MGQSHSYCTDGEEGNKTNVFVAVEEEVDKLVDTETTFTVLEKISDEAANTTEVVFVDTVTPCSSTMDTEVAEDLNFWETSLKQTISDEANTTKVVFVDTISPCSTTTTDNTEATEGIVSDMEQEFEQTACEKMVVAAPTPKKTPKNVNRKKKTYHKATPGKTPKKSTRSKKHKTPKKERTYAQIAAS